MPKWPVVLICISSLVLFVSSLISQVPWIQSFYMKSVQFYFISVFFVCLCTLVFSLTRREEIVTSATIGGEKRYCGQCRGLLEPNSPYCANCKKTTTLSPPAIESPGKDYHFRA